MMTDAEKKVLQTLVDNDDYSRFIYMSFNMICSKTGLERKVVRRACRRLTRMGLAQFSAGLWTDIGTPAGSGYAATKEAASALAA